MGGRKRTVQKAGLSREARILAAFVCTLIAVPLVAYAVAFFATAWPPLTASVRVDGVEVTSSTQLSRDSRYLRVYYPDGLYVVDLVNHRLGSPSSSAHKVLFGYFHPEEGFFGVPVEKDHAKSEHEPHLTIGHNKVSFVDLGDRSVEVAF